MNVSIQCACPRLVARGSRCSSARRGAVVVARAEDDKSKVVRAYSEDDGAVTVPGLKPGEKPQADGTFYIDQAQEERKDVMSDDMKRKLRDEYVGWGGAPNKPMATNPFLIIIVVVSALAVAAKITGALDF